MGKISTDTDGAFRVSLSGESAFSTNMLDFASHSGFDYPKMEEDMVEYFSYTFVASPSVGITTIKTITHNLGYMPMCIVFVEDFWASDTFTRLPTPIWDFSSGTIRAYTTTTQFVIEADLQDEFDTATVAGNTYKFKYQIWTND